MGTELGLEETASEVKKLNDPDVDLYAWITDGGDGAGRAYIAGACDSRRHRKTSLTKGPSRRNAVVETAEVSNCKNIKPHNIVFFKDYE